MEDNHHMIMMMEEKFTDQSQSLNNVVVIDALTCNHVINYNIIRIIPPYANQH